MWIFPFWEAAGKTDICKAIEFLKRQYNDERNSQAVIAFSDSADYKKIEDYIKNPHQYFRCLNSFKGLLLAGSDPDRIIYEKGVLPQDKEIWDEELTSSLNDFVNLLVEKICIANYKTKIEAIDSMDGLKSEKIQKIIYVHDGEYIDLHKTSPGTQTNAVMEYILHSESTIPLFIDQPEDNIDNEARYSKLTKWIRKQKFNRQIILVTHDAATGFG
jgi:hypothetical protein